LTHVINLHDPAVDAALSSAVIECLQGHFAKGDLAVALSMGGAAGSAAGLLGADGIVPWHPYPIIGVYRSGAGKLVVKLAHHPAVPPSAHQRPIAGASVRPADAAGFSVLASHLPRHFEVLMIHDRDDTALDVLFTSETTGDTGGGPAATRGTDCGLPGGMGSPPASASQYFASGAASWGWWLPADGPTIEAGGDHLEGVRLAKPPKVTGSYNYYGGAEAEAETRPLYKEY